MLQLLQREAEHSATHIPLDLSASGRGRGLVHEALTAVSAADIQRRTSAADRGTLDDEKSRLSRCLQHGGCLRCLGWRAARQHKGYLGFGSAQLSSLFSHLALTVTADPADDDSPLEILFSRYFLHRLSEN